MTKPFIGVGWLCGAALLCCLGACSDDESTTGGTGATGASTSGGGAGAGGQAAGGGATGGGPNGGEGGTAVACGGADGVPVALASLDCAHADVLCVDDAAGDTQEYATIQACADAVQPGQVCLVHPGVYDERVVPPTSGTEQGYVSFAAYPGGDKPIMRGFQVAGVSYVRVIGFEITHDSLDYNHGIQLGDVDHVAILDNDIHEVQGHAVRWYTGSGSYVTVRGNEMYLAGCPQGVAGACSGNGWAVQMHTGDHNLIEYNHAQRVGDFVNIHTTESIVRNNYLHDFRNSYWPDGGGDGLHCDMFQPTGSADAPSTFQIYESNFMGDNIELNSHVLQMRSTYEADHDIVYRGNVAYNHGSYGMQCGGIDRVYYFNNTSYQLNQLAGWNAPVCGYNEESGNYSLDNQNLNNLFADNGDGPPILGDTTGNSVTSSNNLCFLTGAHASCFSTDDPLFADADNADFHLQSGSPAADGGTALTTVTSASGSGTAFDVADPGFFTDGFGIVLGDRIRVGDNQPATITAISGSTVTVDATQSWSQGDGVFWRHQDATPDVGAYDYRASGYELTAALGLDDGAEVPLGVVTLAATVNEPELVRFVEFWIDGLPVAMDYDAPYRFCWDASDAAAGSTHHVRMVARPLYASPTLAYEDEATITLQ